MKKIIFALLLNSLFLSGKVLAQKVQPEVETTQQIGLTFSTLGGAGLYYMLPSSGLDHFKFTGIYIYSRDRYNTDSYFSIGAEYQRDLMKADVRRGYFTVGGHVENEFSTEDYTYSFSDFGEYDDENDRYFNAGVGLGLDIGDPHKGLIVNFHISYQLTTAISGREDTRVGLGAGIGMGFNF